MSKNPADRTARTEYGRYHRMAAEGFEIVVEPAQLEVRSVEPLEGRTVRLVLSDGSIVERDLRHLLRGPMFEPVAGDDAFFRRVRVEGGTIAWPNGADIAPETLIWAGVPPREGQRPDPWLRPRTRA